MAVNLSPIWGAGAQLFDNSGNVLSGGKIYTYAAGTTTPATTYTSSSGITANSNPIILNSAGRVPYEIWLSDTLSYKFVLKDSNDTLIATYDNLVGINSNFIAYTAQQEIQTATAGQTVFNLTTMQYQPATNNLSVYVDGVNQYGPGAQYAYVETDSDTVTFVSGLHVGASVKFTTASPVAGAVMNAENVAYDPPFTGAVGTNVELKLAQTVSVMDFGAVADWDGSTGTDNTAAFQAALDSGFGVYVPDGYYKIEGVLKLSNGDYIFGNNPNGASFGGTGYPQSAHLIFTTSGSSCFQNNNPSSGLYHGGVSNLSIETSTRDWIFDLNGTLGFEFIGLRLENQYATGGGLRSTKINPVASNPTWLNRIIGVEIRVPDASTSYLMSIDWSDSDFSNCAFTGGKGVFDSGPGNNKYNNCIFDRANTSGAGLTLTTYDASRKPTVVTGCCFDANDGYGLILDGTSVAGGTFSPSIVGCSFRNYTTGVSYEILLKNTYGSPCFGGTITGCSFTQEQRTPINFDSTIWQRLNWVGNYHAYTFSQIVAPDINDEYSIFDRQGSNVPSGIGMFSGSNTIRGMSNVSTFAGANLNNYAGLMTGCINQNSPFVAASLDKNGTATQLSLVTGNVIRLQVTADGQSLLPYTDNYMQLGYYGKRMSVIFAATGTINTSDANEKTDIRPLDIKEKAVALAIKAQIKAFKFKDAIEKKGNDARIHFGVLAQDVKAAFEVEGLVAEEYGIFCSDTWINDDGVEQTRLGVRYDELFAFLMGAI